MTRNIGHKFILVTKLNFVSIKSLKLLNHHIYYYQAEYQSMKALISDDGSIWMLYMPREKNPIMISCSRKDNLQISFFLKSSPTIIYRWMFSQRLFKVVSI